MALILAQNKELIKYSNKLKLHLSKAYKAIETVEVVNQENVNLRHENEYLKKENIKLMNYIENTFEVVHHLFDFSKNSLKYLVDNFIKSFEKH